MSIQIRIVENNDELILANNFFNAIYKTNRSIKDFEWEFVNGPFGKAIYVIAIDDAVTDHIKVVGIQCAIPIELMDPHGNKELSAKSEDTLVDPSYRGQKIFERMYDLLFEECRRSGIKYIWGFTPAKKAFERINFEIPYHAHQALMIFNPGKAYRYLSELNPKNKLSDKLRIAGLTAISFVKRMGVLQSPSRLTMKSIPPASKSSIIEKFYAHTQLRFLHLNSNYLHWRLMANPFGNNYENYQFFEADQIVADVLINYRSPGLGYIEQMMFAPSLDINARKKIIRSIIIKMKSKVNLIRVLCFDINTELKEQQQLLNGCGFFLLPRGAHFVWKSFVLDGIRPSDLFLNRLFTQGNQ